MSSSSVPSTTPDYATVLRAVQQFNNTVPVPDPVTFLSSIGGIATVFALIDVPEAQQDAFKAVQKLLSQPSFRAQTHLNDFAPVIRGALQTQAPASLRLQVLQLISGNFATELVLSELFPDVLNLTLDNDVDISQHAQRLIISAMSSESSLATFYSPSNPLVVVLKPDVKHEFSAQLRVLELIIGLNFSVAGGWEAFLQSQDFRTTVLDLLNIILASSDVLSQLNLLQLLENAILPTPPSSQTLQDQKQSGKTTTTVSGLNALQELGVLTVLSSWLSNTELNPSTLASDPFLCNQLQGVLKLFATLATLSPPSQASPQDTKSSTADSNSDLGSLGVGLSSAMAVLPQILTLLLTDPDELIEDGLKIAALTALSAIATTSSGSPS